MRLGRSIQDDARRWSCALAVLALSWLGACKSKEPPPSPGPRFDVEATADVTEPALMLTEVRTFARRFESTVAGTGSLIATRTKDPVVRERSLRWRIQVIPAIHTAASDADPRVVLANLWAMCARLRFVLEQHPEDPLMGDQNEAALAVARELEGGIVAIARAHLAPDKVEVASSKIEGFAQSQNVYELFGASAGVAVPVAEVEATSNPVKELLGLPLAPLQGMQGIGDSPEELRRISDVAVQFQLLAQALPDILRWQMELLLLSVDELPTMKSIQEFARACTEFSAHVGALPQRIGAEVRTTIESSQPSLASVQTTVQSVEKTIRDAKPVVEALNATLQTADALVRTVHEAFPPAPPPAPGALDARRAPAEPPESKVSPLTAADITAVAQQTTATLAELRGLLADIQTATTNGTVPALQQTTQATIQDATQHAAGLVDRIFWRALILLAALFGMLACLRFVRRAPREPRA